MPNPEPNPSSQGALATATLALTACIALFTTGGPLRADPLKATMGEMARTTKEAKAALSSVNPSTFDAILKAYADEAKAGMALVPGASAKSQDLRSRFSALAATADAARQSGSTSTGFRAAFGALVNECRSCHAVYK